MASATVPQSVGRPAVAVAVDTVAEAGMAAGRALTC